MRSLTCLVLVLPLLAGCTVDASGTAPEPEDLVDAVVTVDTTVLLDTTADTVDDTSSPAETIVGDTAVADTSSPADTLVADALLPDTFVADTLVADTFVADTFVAETNVSDASRPDSADASTQDAATPVATSCSALHTLQPSLPSGVYKIDPDGAADASRFDVYCDMETDGGGWTLVLAYAHAAATNPAIVPGTPPTSPTTGFSHFGSLQLQTLAPFTAVRFYCQTSNHARRLHFRTSDANAVSYIRGNVSAMNTNAMWQTGFTLLAGHTATLPAATDSTPAAPINPLIERRMTDFPFFDYGAAHFAVGGFGSRWECDDWPNSGAHATLHQVWVR